MLSYNLIIPKVYKFIIKFNVYSSSLCVKSYFIFVVLVWARTNRETYHRLIYTYINCIQKNDDTIDWYHLSIIKEDILKL